MARVYSGVIAVYKPRGMGSAAVTNTIKKLLKSKAPLVTACLMYTPALSTTEFSGPGQWNKKIKVGHGGTLDREAQGVMAVGSQPVIHIGRSLTVQHN
ncbi:hypothetical protein SARC_12229 [Sphaeroforma arctica JP610]|uniref:tRNA pseudouridine synthase B n=1 Tax=Sphaeroforma arctica JP610 TaxID=667725 RepID=A0A0L0FFJ7_9EUKA|nr:hypothetical protein SARC_12229 [Sphaeroforma arctica JP610]KNC75241.1 hypothetical protein SARC_12229 [Sphaeroforma arctica JP610]|eukprot:XP_014149143.1 hypothetical protein SARC_12229 [Sphaeroforma arctica JP610]